MIEELKQSDHVSPLLIGSTGLMTGSFLFSIILGPIYCHYINLTAFGISIVAIVFLVKNFNKYNSLKKFTLTGLLVFNLALGFYLASIKYGYFSWHYTGLFRLIP
jgi:hypothetical protein